MLFKIDFLILSIFLLWLVVLTFLTSRFYFYYSRLIKNGKKESLVEVLDEMNQKQKKLEEELKETIKRCENLEKNDLSHIQKIGLLRFNPFKDTGGDQSFILALLDAKNTGVVISSLHTRTGTRWYAKRVVNGRGIEYDLSSDEEKVLKESKFSPVN